MDLRRLSPKGISFSSYQLVNSDVFQLSQQPAHNVLLVLVCVRNETPKLRCELISLDKQLSG
jgi:hypothetical protein